MRRSLFVLGLMALGPGVQAKTSGNEDKPHEDQISAPDFAGPVLAPADAGFLDRRGGAGWGDRCFLHLQAGRLDWALAACERGLAASPLPKVKGALLYNLGMIAEKQGKHDSAILAFEQSLLARPGNKTVQAALNRCRAAHATAGSPAKTATAQTDTVPTRFASENSVWNGTYAAGESCDQWTLSISNGRAELTYDMCRGGYSFTANVRIASGDEWDATFTYGGASGAAADFTIYEPMPTKCTAKAASRRRQKITKVRLACPTGLLTRDAVTLILQQE